MQNMERTLRIILMIFLLVAPALLLSLLSLPV